MKVAFRTGEITKQGHFQAFLSLPPFALFYGSGQQMEQELDIFTQKVKAQSRNIALKSPPEALELALTTNFSVCKAFKEAFKVAEVAEVDGNEGLRLRFLPWMTRSQVKLSTVALQALLKFMDSKECLVLN